MEIFQILKENSKDTNWQGPAKPHGNAATLTSLCPDISPSNSQFFEVLYIGKIKVSHRKVPETFIDDALEQIKVQLRKARELNEGNSDFCQTTGLDSSTKNGKLGAWRGASHQTLEPIIGNNENDKNICNDRNKLKPFSQDDIHVNVGLRRASGSITDENNFDHSARNASSGTDNKSDIFAAIMNEDSMRRVHHELGFRRARAGSVGVIETLKAKKKRDDKNHNRTMLFHVGKTDLRIISPDRKEVLFHENFKDVVGCVQGLKHNEHFGFICREVDDYIGYIFKCESDSIADDLVSVITQSFQSNKEMRELKQPVLSCDQCPMVWFHRLCAEIEGVGDKKTQALILKKIDTLPAEEQEIIRAKFFGTESSIVKEQNEFLMILLRTHCEAKQSSHVHETAESRSEFLNQYLGGSTIFMKAKRSLTNSFDHLLKRKGSQVDSILQTAQRELLNRRTSTSLNDGDSAGSKSSGNESGKKPTRNHIASNEIEQLNIQFQKEKRAKYDSKNINKKHSFPDIAAIAVNNQKIEKNFLQSNAEVEENENKELGKTPMMNIFLKVGSNTKSPTNEKSSADEMVQTPNGSWRQAIFNRVVTPSKFDTSDHGTTKIRKKEELRDLWKKAINQQLLLIRMEKENARLRARQEEATVKRIKLKYDELGTVNKEYMGIWELISNTDSRLVSLKCDSQVLLQAIRQGVPPAKRGDVWHFLSVQYCLKQPPFEADEFPNYNVSYEDLLKQLTSFQHAILIDLGRTFPNHPYFSSPLGPGQLALFNLLKAYSLLDPQVGYCQGLSFIAGVLLLHMSEEAAFLLLRHLMFRRGIRKQYLPDMAAFQVQLYQLTRLLYDTLPRLYAHLDRNEVAPTLYAAPWMLTLFASQFPLGFVTRVFDLLFLEHTTDIIFRVILALLEEHMECLLAAMTFEEIMNYLKNEIPKMNGLQVEKILKRVLTMDISKRLHEYEVEYYVLQEEMSAPRPKLEELKKLELENKRLADQNLALMEQLEIANRNTGRLEKSKTTQQYIISRLEMEISNLEINMATLGDYITSMHERHRDFEIPGDIRRIISNIELAELRSSKHPKTESLQKRKTGENAILKKSLTSLGFIEDDLFHTERLTDFHNNQELRRGERCRSNSLRGVPLKVIVDEDDEERRGINYDSSNLTSKITSGVSTLFNPLHNEKKSARVQRCSPENSFIGNNKICQDFVCDTDQLRSFSKNIDSFHIKDSEINGQNIEKAKDDKQSVEIKENSHSKLSEDSIKIHPLDSCNDVSIIYNGTTQLKSIKSSVHKLKRSSTTIPCE